MKVEQNSSFQPITITLESRGELAVVMASLAKTSFSVRQNCVSGVYKEELNEKYENTGYELFEKLEQLFKATKPQTT